MKRTACIAIVALAAVSACKQEAPPPKEAPPVAAPVTATRPPEPAPAASAPAPTEALEAAAFTKKLPAVGDRAEEQTVIKMTLTMTMSTGGAEGKTKTMNMATVERERRQEEILAVGPGFPTKVKVTFLEKSGRMTEGAKGSQRTNPVTGRTFIVDKQKGQVRVLSEQGKPAPKNQAKLIEPIYANLGQPDPLLTALPTRVLQPGEKLPELAKGVADAIKDKAADMEARDVTVTFKGATAAQGTFAVALTLNKIEGTTSFTMKLSGELRLWRATAQVAGLTLLGPVTVGSYRAAGAKTSMKGSGQMRFELNRKPL